MDRLIQNLQNSKHIGRIIFALAFLLYANTIPNGWTIDDGLVIHNNRSVQRGLAGLPAIFGSDYIESSNGEKLNAIAGGRYRPLTPAIYAISAELLARPVTDASGKMLTDAQGDRRYNLGANTAFPHLMHLLNALAYALLCWVFYGVLILLLRDFRQGAFIAFLSTLLFAVHPLHTEAVANAKGLDEILSLLLSLLSLWLFVLAVDGKGHKAALIAGGAVCLLLATMAKENALTFLAIIPLTLWFFRSVKPAKLAALCSPMGAGAAIYLFLRLQAVGSLSLAAPDDVNIMNNPFLVIADGQAFAPLVPGSDVMVLQHPTKQSIVPMPATERLATVSYTWLKYLQLFIAPVQLSYDYYPRQIAPRTFGDPLVMLSLLLHSGAFIWAVINIRRRRLAAYGILFYFLSFSIVSNLFFPVGTNMAERFLFMPSAGLCIAGAAGLAVLAERYAANTVLAGVGLLALLFSVRTIARNFNWKDNLTLMQHDLEIATSSAKIRSDYGEVVLRQIGEERATVARAGAADNPDAQAEHTELLRSTLPLYKEALDVYPMYGLVWFNLARTHHWLGETETISPNERLTHLLTALAAYKVTDVYKPRQYLKEVDTMRSLCYASLGKLYGRSFGDMDKAFEYLQTARSINRHNAYALFLLGTAYDIQGNSDSAYHYTRAAYNADSTARDYIENYAQITQKLVIQGKLPATSLSEAARLLQKVAGLNAGLPDDNPTKADLTTRTQRLIQKTDSLRSALEKTTAPAK